MSLTRTLQEISRLGISLSVHDDRLQVSAPRGALTDEVRERIAANREELLQFLRERAHDTQRRNVRIEHVDRSEPIPASYGQQRLWLIEQLGSEVPVYNMYFAGRFTGDLDTAAFRSAIDDLVARHEIMRTALAEHDDGLRQVVDPVCPPAFTEHDCSDGGFDELMASIVATKFDLSRPPLIRFDLIRTSAREWTFVLTQHHVISDGWSVSLIKKELSELYAARVEHRAPNLPDLPVQYADYAVWERNWVSGDLAEAQRAFWRDRLADLPPLLELAPARRRAAVQSYRGKALTWRYDDDFMARVHALCANCGTTLYGALTAAYALLLSRMTRADDIAIGSPLASRPYPALENTLGLFFNSITIRLRPNPGMSVRDYLTSARRTTFEAFAHQDLPFDQVVHAVAPERSTAHSPLFQAVFILQSYPEAALSLPGVESVPVSAPIYAAQYDLMLKVREENGGAHGLLIYNDELLSEEDAHRFTGWFRRIVTAMADADQDTPIGELSIVDDDERASAERWNAATARPVGSTPIHEKVLSALRSRPNEPALTFRGGHTTGSELATRAEEIAAGLVEAGLRLGDRVGVLLPRCPDLVATLLGVLRAGMTYVPLDGAVPAQRSLHALDTAGCTALIVGGPYADSLPAYTGSRLHVAELTGDAPPRAAGTDVAYVIFTSGSTGTPKGVEVTHANLANLVVALDEAVPLPDSTTWLAVTNVTFDIAVVELLWTLTRGVRVVLTEGMDSLTDHEPANVPDLISGERVSFMQATPTFVRTVLRLPGGPEALGGLDGLLVGGEALDLPLARKLKGLGIRTVTNVYGPTETTVWSTSWTVPDDPDEVLVGRPFANTSAHVVDAGLRPVPIGMYGELVLGGAGVTRGYAANPGQTAERFRSVGWLDGGRPVYRTGDIARTRPNGEIELVGRVDNQIKLNGYRIELEEIEQVLSAVPGIAACAAAVRQHNGRDVLVAYYVPAPGPSVDDENLRARLALTLPRQMIPDVFAPLAALPMTPNGKVDRLSLPAVLLTGTSRDAVVEPDDGFESTLLDVWRRVLGAEAIGVTDDFFRAGGNSILVARLLTEIRAAAVPEARIVDLFRYPTVRGYAALVRGTTRPAEETDEQRSRSRRQQQALRKRRLRAKGVSEG